MPNEPGASEDSLSLQESTVGSNDASVVLHVSGHLDGAAFPVFVDRLAAIVARNPPLVVLDMRGVEFVSSMVWGNILSRRARQAAGGRDLVLADVSDDVRAVLQVMGIDQVLTIYASVEAALAERKPS